MSRPIKVTIHCQAIAENINRLKQFRPQSQCFPVVKANAYGHGLDRIYPALKNADGLALLEVEGAALLRAHGWNKPILLLEGCFLERDFLAAMDLACDLVIHSQAQLEQLTRYAKAFTDEQHHPRVFLKVNTGMNRLGFDLAKAPKAIDQIERMVGSLSWPKPVLMTHFANADSLGDCALPAVWQHQALMALKPANWKTSLGNSAALLNYPELCGDYVRPGIASYGAAAGPHPASEHGLKAAMVFSSEIIAIQKVSKNQSVGYGSRWRAQRDSSIAIVACGYADGYPRHAPDGTPVLVNGRRVSLAGRVSMDMLTVDVTDLVDVKVGSPVQLWGDHLPVDEVAHCAGTIGYELLCAITPRVPVDVLI